MLQRHGSQAGDERVCDGAIDEMERRMECKHFEFPRPWNVNNVIHTRAVFILQHHRRSPSSHLSMLCGNESMWREEDSSIPISFEPSAWAGSKSHRGKGEERQWGLFYRGVPTRTDDCCGVVMKPYQTIDVPRSQSLAFDNVSQGGDVSLLERRVLGFVPGKPTDGAEQSFLRKQ